MSSAVLSALISASDHLPVVQAYAVSNGSRVATTDSRHVGLPRLNAAQVSRTDRELRHFFPYNAE